MASDSTPSDFRLVGRRGHLRQRAAAERAVHASEQAQEQRALPAIVRQRNRPIVVHRRHDEVGRAVAGLNRRLAELRHERPFPVSDRRVLYRAAWICEAANSTRQHKNGSSRSASGSRPVRSHSCRGFLHEFLGPDAVAAIQVDRREAVVAREDQLRLSDPLGQRERLAIRVLRLLELAAALMDLRDHDQRNGEVIELSQLAVERRRPPAPLEGLRFRSDR